MDIVIAFGLGMIIMGVAYLVVAWPMERGRWRRGYMAGYMDALNRGDGEDNADNYL